MVKRRKRVTRRAKQEKPATSFPLGMFFVVTPQLMPSVALSSVATLLYPARDEVGGPIVIWGLAALAVGLILLRLPSLVRTVLFDREVVLGPDTLHIPVVRFLQFRPWELPFRDIESVTTPRKSGSSTRILLTMRDGRQIQFPSAYVVHYPTVVAAIERRI